MKSHEIDIAFPVLAFTPDLENWGFPDLDRLTKCGSRTLKENLQNGMELIDAQGRSWRVLSIRRTGRAGSILSLIPGFGPPQSRIEQDLEALPDVSLEELKRRASVSMEKFSWDYSAFEGGEAEFAERLRQLDEAKTYAELYDVVGAEPSRPTDRPPLATCFWLTRKLSVLPLFLTERQRPYKLFGHRPVRHHPHSAGTLLHQE